MLKYTPKIFKFRHGFNLIISLDHSLFLSFGSWETINFRVIKIFYYISDSES